MSQTTRQDTQLVFDDQSLGRVVADDQNVHLSILTSPSRLSADDARRLGKLLLDGADIVEAHRARRSAT